MGEAVGAELYLTETNLVRFALNYSRPSNEIVLHFSAVLQVLPCLAIIRSAAKSLAEQVEKADFF